MMPLSHFHLILREWFEQRITDPTESQAQGWPAITRGRHTLISAPTGSGKTSEAFLVCIDRAAARGSLPETAEVRQTR